jgi:hypothetical protein
MSYAYAIQITDHETVFLTPPEKGLIMSHVSPELSQMTLLNLLLGPEFGAQRPKL